MGLRVEGTLRDPGATNGLGNTLIKGYHAVTMSFKKSPKVLAKLTSGPTKPEEKGVGVWVPAEG